MIDEKTIEQLITAFYEGNTTSEEEEVLLNYFKTKAINEKFYADSELFALLNDSSRIPLPDGFSERLEERLDEHIRQTTNYNPFTASVSHKIKKLYLFATSTAAVVLLCLGLFFLTGKQNNSSFEADTYSNPKEAAVAVEQALLLVSNKLNQGLAPLETVKEGLNTTNQLLNENFK